jgi:dTDP-4-dehydrorhamnose reductase
MKVSILGKGFIAEHLPYHQIDARVDYSSKQIHNLLDLEKPDVLINCIGYTGRPNIDQIEANREKAALTNTALPILLAEACAQKSIHMIQIGSGCLFFGKSPHIIHAITASAEVDTGWKETDFPNPQSYYSKTKAACDYVLGDMKNVATLRIRMPISTKDHHRNLINKLRGYKQIIDIPNSMTFLDDLARCIDWTIKTGQTGIFHVANPQPITAAQIMREYQKHRPHHQFEIISEEQLDKLTIAKRSNCLLDTSKLRLAGFEMTPSEQALKQCMVEYVKNLKE